MQFPSLLLKSLFRGFGSILADKEETYGGKETHLSYTGVKEDDDNQFCVYPGNMGFKGTAANVNGCAVELMLNNREFDKGVIHDAENGILQMIYSDDVDYEKKYYFKQYSRVSAGEIISVNSGEVVVTDIKIHGGAL